MTIDAYDGGQKLIYKIHVYLPLERTFVLLLPKNITPLLLMTNEHLHHLIIETAAGMT